ncbi:MAG: hypothetical protein U0586_09960 [Candidatus Brocadiaceae bacterium]
MNGTINTQGLTTRVWFQYGTTSNAYTINSSEKTVKGSLNKKVSINISGLTSQTTYYYRIKTRIKPVPPMERKVVYYTIKFRYGIQKVRVRDPKCLP